MGIYHRMWGAARHDRATGVHRPLLGDVLIFEEPSLLAPGCLERLLEAMVGRIEEAVEDQVADYRRK